MIASPNARGEAYNLQNSSTTFREIDPENPFVVAEGLRGHGREVLDEAAKKKHAHVTDEFVDTTPRPSKRRRKDELPRSPWAFSSASFSSPSLSSLMKSPAASSKLTAPSYPTIKGYRYALPPPTTPALLASVAEYGIPNKIYPSPHYSKASDAPERPREYAGLVFHLKGGMGLDTLEEWAGSTLDNIGYVGKGKRRLDPTGVTGWEYASAPPSAREVRRWLQSPHVRKPVVPGRPKRPSQVYLCLS